MRENEMIQTLKQEVEIPDVVKNKANEAFAMIKAEAEQKKTSRFTHSKKRKLISHSGIAAALIAILAAGTFTVGAAAHSLWSNALLADMDISEDQQSSLEQSEAVDFIQQTATDAGVTITAVQTVADDNFAYIAFKVDGYELPEKAEPAINEINLTVGGRHVDFSGKFYDGLVWDADGNVTMADGSEVQYDEDGLPIGKYVDENGSLEFICCINARYLSDYSEPTIIGKTIHVEFKDLGIYSQDPKAIGDTATTEVEGCWQLSWPLQGTEDTYHYDMETPLADSGLTLVSADISPVSVKAACRYPSGYPASSSMFGIRIRMKDGTELYPNGPGNGGSLFPTADVYAWQEALGRIIDPTEVESLIISVPVSTKNNEQNLQDIEIPIDADSANN